MTTWNDDDLFDLDEDWDRRDEAWAESIDEAAARERMRAKEAWLNTPEAES